MLKTAAITIAAFFIGFSPVWAQTAENDISAEEAKRQLKEILTEDVVKAAEPLNKKIDYIARNYDENDLKLMIRNMEKTDREAAKMQGKDYIPYDRRIDVNDPEQVKRFLRKRIDIIF